MRRPGDSPPRNNCRDSTPSPDPDSGWTRRMTDRRLDTIFSTRLRAGPNPRGASGPPCLSGLNPALEHAKALVSSAPASVGNAGDPSSFPGRGPPWARVTFLHGKENESLVGFADRVLRPTFARRVHRSFPGPLRTHPRASPPTAPRAAGHAPPSCPSSTPPAGHPTRRRTSRNMCPAVPRGRPRCPPNAAIETEKESRRQAWP